MTTSSEFDTCGAYSIYQLTAAAEREVFGGEDCLDEPPVDADMRDHRMSCTLCDRWYRNGLRAYERLREAEALR